MPVRCIRKSRLAARVAGWGLTGANPPFTGDGWHGRGRLRTFAS
jgi:hypothetical protein